MSARAVRRFLRLGTGVPGGRGFLGAQSNHIRGAPSFPPPVFFLGTGPARPDSPHPATAVCEVAAAPAERVVAGCAFSAASTRRHSTWHDCGLDAIKNLPRTAVPALRPQTEEPHFLARGDGRARHEGRSPLAKLASKRKMELAAGETAPRRGERRASSTARGFAGAAAPRALKGAHPAAVSRATRKTGMARTEAASGRGSRRGFHRLARREADNAAPTRSRSTGGGVWASRRDSRRDGTNRPAARCRG